MSTNAAFSFPPNNLNYERLVNIIGSSTSYLSKYDASLETLPNASLILSPLTSNEAVLSSKIEGTQTTLIELLQYDGEDQQSDNLSDNHDLEEVRNYRSTVLLAEQEMSDKPLSLFLIRALHKKLLQGVRGQNKSPGEFRKDQNWIGKKGDTIDKARYVPPDPLILPDLLDNWIDYVKRNDMDSILQTAIVHAQFEIIHPFLDGNGRIGRMLIPLVLYQRKILHRPVFYMSEYLEEHRDEYNDHLLAITENNDWNGWLEFFIEGVKVQAIKSNEKVLKIRNLYDSMSEKFQNVSASVHYMDAVNAFFENPILSGSKFRKITIFSRAATANAILKKLTNAGLITCFKQGRGRAPSMYVMPELIDIIK